jgi:hypothetical protein
MTDRMPVEITNLDRYGSAEIPWSRPHDLLAGGLTVLLGSDDEDDMTTLSGVELYPDVWTHVANIRNLRGHPFEFYQKCGFVIVGVVPDANGLGKPDILMAKRVADS